MGDFSFTPGAFEWPGVPPPPGPTEEEEAEAECYVVSVDMAHGQGSVAPAGEDYAEQPFRIEVLSTPGQLERWLQRAELATISGMELSLGVSCEGVNLCRLGQLEYVVLCWAHENTLVTVVDVQALPEAFVLTPESGGTSLKEVLGNPGIWKVVFDPRNAADILAHQYEVSLNGVVDLQLAEVAARRMGGLTVRYVTGMAKVLAQNTDGLSGEEFAAVESFLQAGFALTDPKAGGAEENWNARPLPMELLAFAATKAWVLPRLYATLEGKLGATSEWWNPVFAASAERAAWWSYEVYVQPSAEAPAMDPIEWQAAVGM
jgi:exonuclease 3'-5' domain-containing protein 1